MMQKYVHPSTYLSYSRTYRLGLLALLAMFLCFVSQWAQAQISLGQSRTFSSFGQPLNATIDIHASPQDLASLRGRSYRLGSGGAVDPSITTRIVAGPTGAMVQLGSLVPINEPFVDVVVELVSDTGASIARSFTMLINPAAGYSAPPIYQAPAPHRTQKASRSNKKTANRADPVDQIDRQIASAKKKLDALEAKINAKNSAPPAPTVAAAPAEIAPSIPAPAPAAPPAVVPAVEPPKMELPNPSEVLSGAINAVNGAINQVAPPPPPAAIPTPAPVARPKPAPARPTAPVAVKQETGLFGFDFLPSAESLGIGGISEEMLIGGGGGLVFISVVIGFFIWRRKRGQSSRRSSRRSSMDDDYSMGDTSAIFGGASDMFASEAATPMEPESRAAAATPDESEEEKPKKKSFLSKFKRKKKEADAEADENTNVDFAALVAASQGKSDSGGSDKSAKAKKAKAAEASLPESSTKIERFVEDKGSQDDDYEGDLAHLTQMPATADEPTIMVSNNRDNTSVHAGSPPTRLMPKAVDKAPEPASFTDKITRINPMDEDEDLDNIASTAFSEMLSEDAAEPMEVVRRTPPAAKKTLDDDSFAETKSAKLVEDVTTELSIDDLDFSSEKTMIMPSLNEMVKISDEEQPKTDEFEFKLDLGGGSKAKPNTAVKGVSQEMPEFNAKTSKVAAAKVMPAAKSETFSVPSMEGFDLPDLADEEIKAPAPAAPAAKAAAAVPAATQAPPMPDLTMPDFSLPDMDSMPGMAQSSPAQATAAKPSMDFELPDLDLPDLAMPEANKPAPKDKPTAAPAKDDGTKSKVEESAAGMINLADLDLSSIKLD